MGLLTAWGPRVSDGGLPNRYGALRSVGSEEDHAAGRRRRRRGEEVAAAAEVGGRRRAGAPARVSDGAGRRCR